MTRIKIPKEIETKVLLDSKRICCLCFGLKNDITIKQGQIAHLDHDNSNYNESNLAFLCLPHHDTYDGKTSQSKNFTIHEAKKYKDKLLEYNLKTDILNTNKDLSEVENYSFEKLDTLNIAVYGCFKIEDNKRVIIDADCDEINQIINNSIKATNSRIYSYSDFLHLHQVTIPKSVIPKWGYEKLNSEIKKNVIEGGHVAAVYFINNEKHDKFTCIISCNEEIINNTSPTVVAEKLINRILNNTGSINQELINLSLNIFYLVCGQIHFDILLDAHEYKNLHYTLDGCERLVREIRNDAKEILKESQLQIEKFLNFWMSHFERYRSIVFLEEKEYVGAVISIFKAMALNPYYPYDDYDSLKENYTKRYAMEIAPMLTEMQEFLKIKDFDPKENLAVMDALWEQIERKETTYHFEILKEIMRRSTDRSDIINLIEGEIQKLKDDSIFTLIAKSEIIRYLKKGTEKINEAYIERFDEAIRYLENAIVIDYDFPVLKTKIGSLMLLKGLHFNNDEIVKEAMDNYIKGLYFLSKLGFRMNPK